VSQFGFLQRECQRLIDETKDGQRRFGAGHFDRDHGAGPDDQRATQLAKLSIATECVVVKTRNYVSL
jgi:hypothetical protein